MKIRELVVDANILVSFFRDNPVRFIVIDAKSLGLKLFIPEHAINELNNNKQDLIKYTKLSVLEVESIIDKLKKLVEIIQEDLLKEFETKAQDLSPHESDKDTPYFALALKLGCPIWSNELAKATKP